MNWNFWVRSGVGEAFSWAKTCRSEVDPVPPSLQSDWEIAQLPVSVVSTPVERFTTRV